MLQLVESNIFEECPNIKIIVHHAGAMIPFFAGRIENILKEECKKYNIKYFDTSHNREQVLESALEYIKENMHK